MFMPEEPAAEQTLKPASDVLNPTPPLPSKLLDAIAEDAPSPVDKAHTLDIAELLLIGMDRPSKGSGKLESRWISAENWVGRLIGEYRIDEELGKGGMGAVFKATNVRVGSTVALKLMRFAPGQSAESMRRFELEARAAAQLNHQNIINVFDVGQVGDLYYLAMEYIEGRPFSELIYQKRLSPQQVIRIALDVCSALECAHSAGVIHRDIKPSNILIEPTGRAQLMDFGLARDIATASKSLTEDGSILGTAHYMSPEQAQGKSRDADSRSDIYALGAVLYEALTGSPPFDGETVLEVIRKVANEDPVPLRTLRKDLDRDLEIVVMKAMDKEPMQRYRSAQALAEDLWRYESGEPILARPPSICYRLAKYASRHRLQMITGTILLASAITVVALTIQDRRRRSGMEKHVEHEARKRVVHFEKAMLKDSRQAHWWLIFARRNEGDLQGALAELERLNPPAENDTDYYCKFWLYSGLLKREAGIEWREDLEKTLLSARSNRLHLLEQTALMHLGEPYTVDAAELKDEARAFWYYHMGMAAKLQEKHEEALVCFERAAACDSDIAECVFATEELEQLTKRR